jgi:pectin methylesterase-like acyl-CoA thioesterase
MRPVVLSAAVMAAIVSLGIPCGKAWGRTWFVSHTRSANFTTIQEAIDAAAHGDTVLVDSGTYVENIDFKGKAILVRGLGPEFTTIDGNQSGIPKQDPQRRWRWYLSVGRHSDIRHSQQQDRTE